MPVAARSVGDRGVWIGGRLPCPSEMSWDLLARARAVSFEGRIVARGRHCSMFASVSASHQPFVHVW